jgi:hypothetical protein
MLNGSKLALALGVSRQMVSLYRKDGRIQEEPGGGYNLDRVREQLGASLTPRRGSSAIKAESASKPRPAKRPMVHRGKAQVATTHPDAEGKSKAELEKEVLAERVRRERIRNDREEGMLVLAEEVSAATESRFRADAQALLGWPRQVGATLAAELGVPERIFFDVLDREVRKFMKSRAMVESE